MELSILEGEERNIEGKKISHVENTGATENWEAVRVSLNLGDIKYIVLLLEKRLYILN